MRKVSIIITYLGIPRFKSGENRYSRLIIANAARHMIHRSIADSDMLTRVVLGHFCSYLQTRVSRFC
jgi:hypothetical protein